MATRVVYRRGVVYKMGCGIHCNLRYASERYYVVYHPVLLAAKLYQERIHVVRGVCGVYCPPARRRNVHVHRRSMERTRTSHHDTVSHGHTTTHINTPTQHHMASVPVLLSERTSSATETLNFILVPGTIRVRTTPVPVVLLVIRVSYVRGTRYWSII